MSANTAWRLLLTVVVIAGSIFFAATKSPALGLDLKGGTRIVLDLKSRDGSQITQGQANETVEVLRRRVDALGATEPNLEVASGNRINVELPGVTDPTKARETIGKTAQLTVHPVLAPAAPLDPESVKGVDTTKQVTLPSEDGGTYTLGPAVIDGKGIGNANAELDPQNGTWGITINFKGDGSSAWQKVTGQAACNSIGDPKRQIAIVLDDRIISNPQVAEDITCGTGISGGSTVISGNFNQQSAKDLAVLIKGGALPLNVSVASQSVIGPELGDQAIVDSRNAVIIGAILTLVFIVAYYRLIGFIAMIALGAYGLITYAIIVAGRLTLTLPGIAGFVLSIGMAMDSNVLVYERVKEELAAGRQMRAAARTGFKNALSAIIDSNATTVLAALTLYFLAVGEVKGFGLTLAVGTFASIFVTLVVLRLMVEAILGRQWSADHAKLMGLKVGSRFRERITKRPPQLMKIAKYFIVASCILTVVSVAGLFVKGINYGIEFRGGRLVEYSTPQVVNLDEARSELGKQNIEGAVVQRSGAQDVAIRVPSLTPEQLNEVNNTVKRLGGGDAKVLRDETTGPSFGAELKRKALIGLLIGVLIQFALVAVRFRWTFGIGAVVGMLHDAILLLGLFVWLERPFDSVFLAALLTVISYSVNDTVVVFDRIREQRRRRAAEDFSDVVNDACVQTLPRTINISLCIMFILVALLFLGGQTLADFALALIIGIILGLYSSVFICSPIAIALERWKPGVRTPGQSAKKVKKANASDAGEIGEVDTAAAAKTSTNRPAPRPRKKSKKRR